MINEQGKRVKVIGSQRDHGLGLGGDWDHEKYKADREAKEAWLKTPEGIEATRMEEAKALELEETKRVALEKLEISFAEKRKVDAKLNELFPNAKSKEVVELDGNKYKRWYEPELSGRRSRGRPQYIRRWHSGWTELKKD